MSFMFMWDINWLMRIDSNFDISFAEIFKPSDSIFHHWDFPQAVLLCHVVLISRHVVCLNSSNCRIQDNDTWTVTDPGFPWGTPTPKSRRPNLLHWLIFPKNCMKMFGLFTFGPSALDLWTPMLKTASTKEIIALAVHGVRTGHFFCY